MTKLPSPQPRLTVAWDGWQYYSDYLATTWLAAALGEPINCVQRACTLVRLARERRRDNREVSRLQLDYPAITYVLGKNTISLQLRSAKQILVDVRLRCASHTAYATVHFARLGRLAAAFRQDPIDMTCQINDVGIACSQARLVVEAAVAARDIVANVHDVGVRSLPWIIVADWLDDHSRAMEASILRLACAIPVLEQLHE